MNPTRLCRLTEEHPSSAVAWYAVGCYYYAAGQHANARRYFGKATSLDDAFAPAWLAFGHAFSAQDESDQVCAVVGLMRTARTASAGLPAVRAGPGRPGRSGAAPGPMPGMLGPAQPHMLHLV